MQLWLTAYINIGAGALFFLAGAFYSIAMVHPWLVPGAPTAMQPMLACCISHGALMA